MKVSVVIPTLNEAQHIERTLVNVYSQGGFHEIIIVDGASRDETEAVCKKYPCRFISTDRRGRAFQMNVGARVASGDVLLFLHADTLLPQEAARAVRGALRDPLVCAGGFSKVFDSDHLLLRGAVARCKLRYWFLRTISGDQGLFVRTSTFAKVGGFPDVRLMEEFALCKKLRREGKIVLLPQRVRTSARRFLEKGVLRCYLRMALVSILYYLRFPPEALERLYYSD